MILLRQRLYSRWSTLGGTVINKVNTAGGLNRSVMAESARKNLSGEALKAKLKEVYGYNAHESVRLQRLKAAHRG